MEAQAGGWQAEVACARLNCGLGAEGAPLVFGSLRVNKRAARAVWFVVNEYLRLESAGLNVWLPVDVVATR